MALSLTVKDFEFIYIGDDIRISVRQKSKVETQVWIEAPREITILREKHYNLEQDDERTGTD